MVAREKAAKAASGGRASNSVVSALSKRRLAKLTTRTHRDGHARCRLLRIFIKCVRQLQSAQMAIGQAGHINQTSIWT